MIVLCSIASVSLMAQQIVVVKYSVDYPNPESYTMVNSEMTLVVSPVKSLFYNVMSQYVDSCMSTPEGAAKLHEIQMKAWRVEMPDGTVTYEGRKLGLAPDKSEYLYVEKNRETGEMTVYDKMCDELCRYVEPLEEMTWEILPDSTTQILDHECVMARTDYHGRRWDVWFAPDLPVQEGPWKLHGLPGLILMAQSGDNFKIVAEDIGVSNMDVPEIYMVNNYEKVDRKKILADNEKYINDFEAIMAAEGIKLNGDGSPANLPKFDRERGAWETDY